MDLGSFAHVYVSISHAYLHQLVPTQRPSFSIFKFTGLFCGYVGRFGGYLGPSCGCIRLCLTRTLTSAVPDAKPLISSINLLSLYFVHFENSYVFFARVLRRFSFRIAQVHFS